MSKRTGISETCIRNYYARYGLPNKVNYLKLQRLYKEISNGCAK